MLRHAGQIVQQSLALVTRNVVGWVT